MSQPLAFCAEAVGAGPQAEQMVSVTGTEEALRVLRVWGVGGGL